MRTLMRLLAATVAACLALLLGAAPAFAHTRLESSDPTDGSSVATAPESVSLTFNEAIGSEFATVTVIGPDGSNYQTGTVTTSGGEVSTAVSPLGPTGRYEIGYRVVSDDGHPVQGSVSFTLTVPGPAAAAAVPTPDAAPPAAAPLAVDPQAAPAAPDASPQPAAAQESTGAPVWPWLLGAVVLVGVGASAALRLGKRASR